MNKLIEYNAEPTASRFHNDDNLFRLIQGCVGCGKTSACITEILMRAMSCPPGPDGVRRPRWAAVRSTYPELKATTIKSWQQWVPDEVCPIVYDVPIRGRMQRDLGDGTKLDFEIVFIAIENEEDVETKLKSFEVNGLWMNEASELCEKLFSFARGRVGRWIPDKDGIVRWKGIIADSNPPKTTHWLYRIFEEDDPVAEFSQYKYPPAVYYDTDLKKYVPSPDAENLRNLPADYYQQQIAGNTEDYIKVMLMGEYGMTRLGKAVFPQYNEREHVAREEMVPDRSTPLILGWDFGLNPSCSFAQVNKLGGLVIYDCLAPADEDLESFVDDYVLPLINKKYAQFKIQAVGDPAARGRSGLDKRTPFDVLAARGIRCVPATTNNFVPRKEAVDHFLNKVGGFKLNPSITYLREAFGGGYVFDQIKGTKGLTKERPNKTNPYSHGMDTIQYIALYVKYSSGSRSVRSSRSDEQEQKKYLWA